MTDENPNRPMPKIGPEAQAERAAREARLALALRANLGRRKAQDRARRVAGNDDPDRPAE